MRAGNRKFGRQTITIPVAASTEINEATLVGINSNGYAVTASKTDGVTVAGCAGCYTDNRNGADGENTVLVERGVFCWNNDGSIKNTDILKSCYVKDANTVTINSDGSSLVGKILGVEDTIVIVETY